MAQTYQQMLQQAITRGQVVSAQNWFDTTYQTLGKQDASSVITSGDNRLTKSLTIGKMYLFSYDPKHKKTLPKYDRFPLVFPFDHAEGGFMGINFHYLPPGLRASLLDGLMSLATDKSFSDSMRLNLNYKLLKNVAKFAPAKEGIKRYLNSHVRSRFFYIRPDEWSKAILLPLDDFVYRK